MKAEINDIQLGYEVIGDQGQPILLIHGFGLNRTIWRELANQYLRAYQVILPDLRGHGESQAPSGPYPMTILAEDIAKLLDFLNIEKVILCGHSMGGYVSLAFAERYPDRLAGFGLITSHAKADSASKRTARYQMVEDVRQYGAIVLAESLAPKLSNDEAIRHRAYQILSHTNPIGIIGSLKGMAERSSRMDLLPLIAAPALVAAGKEDQIIDVDLARQTAEELHRGKFLLIDDAGHMPMLENPKALAKGINWLVSKVEKEQSV